MILRKDPPAERLRGAQCPMRGHERCAGAACAWFVLDGEREGHCAVLDVARLARGGDGDGRK